MTATLTPAVGIGCTRLGQWTPAQPAWHDARTSRIGGSEIAAILGLSPWESPYSLWQRKAGRIPAKTESRSMGWGTRLEPVILSHFYDQHPEFTAHPDGAGTYVNDRRGWQLANPDSVAVGSDRQVLVEVKTADKYDGWQWGADGTDHIPPYYLAQVRWYLSALGLDLGYVAVLIGGNDYREYPIEPDRTFEVRMLTVAQDFVASVAAGQAPPLDAHKQTYEAVRQLHPQINGLTVEIPPDIAGDYADAVVAAKAAAARVEETRTQLAAEMGEAQHATCFGQPLAWREARGSGVPFVKSHPALGRAS